MWVSVMIVLLGLASMMDIDLFDAVIAKEVINNSRTWE